jgi:hypothetical protein
MKIIIYQGYVNDNYPGIHIFCSLERTYLCLAHDHIMISANFLKLKTALAKHSIVVLRKAPLGDGFKYKLSKNAKFFYSLKGPDHKDIVIEDDTIDEIDLQN